LRECYHSTQLCFTKAVAGAPGAGDFGGVKQDWASASVVFPTPLKGKKGKPSLAQEILNSVEFLSVHIVAIAGHEGDLLVEDVRLEKIK
jgi:hypothetical protein